MARQHLLSPAYWLIVGLTFLSFGLRVWRLDAVPPGFRDDELINTQVISQKILDRELAVYYPDASGHEALYHALNAITLKLIGRNAFGIRLTSVFLGVLAIPLLYQVGRRLYDRRTGLLAAALLGASFWGLMYSRTAIRHVGLPFFTLLAFYAFWRYLHPSPNTEKKRTRFAILSALCLGLAFYIYFAARGIPLILIAFAAYLFLADRALLRARWRGLALSAALATVMAAPLLWTLQQNPEAEGRVAELATPVIAARQGDLAPLLHHIDVTLRMFHSRGDSEWLYNIADRPLFALPVAALFWLGVAIAVRHVLQALRTRSREGQHASAFLLLWWLIGISPAFLSQPPASMSHTILAQPATYLLLALPLTTLRGVVAKRRSPLFNRWLVIAAPVLLFAAVALRDVPAYFHEWPNRGNVRFLYHADTRDVAQALHEWPGHDDFGMTGLLDGPWSRLALDIELQQAGHAAAKPRWYDSRRAVIFSLANAPAYSFNGYPLLPTPYQHAYVEPALLHAGGYTLNEVSYDVGDQLDTPICFQNGLCTIGIEYQLQQQRLLLTWKVQQPLALPDMPLISNPPPPGVYGGPRLAAFAHLLDSSGHLIVGDDGLWVDPQTLYPGDQFQQQHLLESDRPQTADRIIFGLYDPKTTIRIKTEHGQDHVAYELP